MEKLQNNTWTSTAHFHKLFNAELPTEMSKWHFFAKDIQYLGHVLRTTCIKPLPSKTAAIKLMKTEKC